MPESSKEKSARREREKALRDAAKEVIRGEEAQYEIDHHVTTGTDSGEGAFKSETTPDICKVVVDKESKRTYVEITGGGLQASFVRTSPEKTGYEVIALQDGQRCMIYGSSTVVYIRPRS